MAGNHADPSTTPGAIRPLPLLPESVMPHRGNNRAKNSAGIMVRGAQRGVKRAHEHGSWPRPNASILEYPLPSDATTTIEMPS
jgi:hypothetical protein